jgi:hypothetical protein
MIMPWYTWLLIVVVLALLVVFALSFPDIRRYWRIRNM